MGRFNMDSTYEEEYLATKAKAKSYYGALNKVPVSVQMTYNHIMSLEEGEIGENFTFED